MMAWQAGVESTSLGSEDTKIHLHPPYIHPLVVVSLQMRCTAATYYFFLEVGKHRENSVLSIETCSIFVGGKSPQQHRKGLLYITLEKKRR